MKLNKKQLVPFKKAENREAGERPARSRHCKQKQLIIMPLSHREGDKQHLYCKPGDLPDCGAWNFRIRIPDHED